MSLTLLDYFILQHKAEQQEEIDRINAEKRREEEHKRWLKLRELRWRNRMRRGNAQLNMLLAQREREINEKSGFQDHSNILAEISPKRAGWHSLGFGGYMRPNSHSH